MPCNVDLLFAIALLAAYVVYNYVKPGTNWLTGQVGNIFGKDAAKIVRHGIKQVRPLFGVVYYETDI